MVVVPTVLGVLAGVCAYAALTHLGAGLRRPRSVTELLFAAMCALVVVYTLCAIPIYRASRVEAYVEWVRLSAMIGQIFHIVLLWFVARYTGFTPRPILAALTAAHATCLAANVLQPAGLAFERVDGLVSKRLPWGEALTTVDAVGGFWLIAAYGVVLADLVYAFWACAVQFRRGRRRSALMLAGSIVLFVSAIPIDMLVHAGVFNFMFTAEFGFLALVGVMSVNLSRESREALDRTNERLRITLNSIGDAVFTTDGEGLIRNMNPAAERLFVTSEHEARGRGFGALARLLDPRTRAACGDPVRRVLDAEAIVHDSGDAILEPRAGDERRVASSGAPLRDGEGELVGAVLVFRDVTEYRTLERELQHSRRLDAIGRLAGGVAHDFNNLLTGMIGYAELLTQELGDSPRLQHYARGMMENGGRAAELTRKLLAFSRNTPTLTAPVGVHALIGDVVEMLRRSIDKRIEIDCRLEASHDRVTGDASQLHGALLNLGVNARDAMPDGGRLTFATETRPDGRLEIRVSDTGCGIPERNLDRIFEPYFTTKGPGAGTGLGLAAVYGTVQEHLGEIQVSSEPGTGTTFVLDLPPALDDDGDAASLPDARADHGRADGTILVIDDERAARDVTGRFLEDLGYRVLLAADGDEGIEVFEADAGGVDAVILDMVMPRRSGAEVFERLRAHRADLAVLISSGFAMPGALDGLLAEGNVGFLGKPFRKADVARALDELLGARPDA